MRRDKDACPATGQWFGMFDRVPHIDEDMTVDQLMRHWPATIRVFLDFRMHCVGCPIASFHSVAEACGEHAVDPMKFLAALRGVVASGA